MSIHPGRFHDRTIELIGISGSLRRASHNTAVLRTLQQALPGTAGMTLFPLHEIPLYNQELDGEHLPEPVRAFKEAIAACDGIVIASPEYNYGIPGVLKNAIDWASRPAGKSPLRNKPALIMTASPGAVGGARAQAQIREALTSTFARVLARPQVVIANVGQKVKDGVLVDEASIKFALEAIDDLLHEIRLLESLNEEVKA
jgi:chromate reductase, NAD(P)H dehydrogenase (quinone)